MGPAPAFDRFTSGFRRTSSVCVRKPTKTRSGSCTRALAAANSGTPPRGHSQWCESPGGRSCPHDDRPDSAERERAGPRAADDRAAGPRASPPEQPTTEQPTTEQPGPSGPRPSPRPARRRPPPSSRRPPPRHRAASTARASDRVIAGVCGGIARYFNIDPVLVRVGAVALAFLGGAGLLAYLAAVLLIPKEGEGGRPPEAPNRGLAITGVVLLVVAIGVVLPFHGGWGAGWGLLPLGFIALAGLFVWRLASGQRPEGDARAVLRAMALGVALIAGCFVLAIGAAWASAAGGNGVVAGHRHRRRPRPDRRRLRRLLGALAHPPGAGRRAARGRGRRRRPRRHGRLRRGHVPPGQRRRRSMTPIAWASGIWSSTCATRT